MRLRVTVARPGPGHVAETSWSASASRSSRPRSRAAVSGLGLFLARVFAERVGGALTLSRRTTGRRRASSCRYAPSRAWRSAPHDRDLRRRSRDEPHAARRRRRRAVPDAAGAGVPRARVRRRRAPRDYDEAMAAAQRREPGAARSSISGCPAGPGSTSCASSRSLDETTNIVVLTGYGSIATAVQSVQPRRDELSDQAGRRRSDSRGVRAGESARRPRPPRRRAAAGARRVGAHPARARRLRRQRLAGGAAARPPPAIAAAEALEVSRSRERIRRSLSPPRARRADLFAHCLTGRPRAFAKVDVMLAWVRNQSARVAAALLLSLADGDRLAGRCLRMRTRATTTTLVGAGRRASRTTNRITSFGPTSRLTPRTPCIVSSATGRGPSARSPPVGRNRADASNPAIHVHRAAFRAPRSVAPPQLSLRSPPASPSVA